MTGEAIFWPMLVGSLPVAIAVGFSSYLILTPILSKLQARRLLKRTKQVDGAAVPDKGSA